MKLAVRHQLPVKGVSLIIGNDLAGEKVLPLPEVIENPMCEPINSSELASEFPAVFSACVITQAQACKSGDLVDISDTFLTTGDKDENSLVNPASRSMESLSKAGGAELDSGDLSLSVDKVLISAEQKKDPSLLRCRNVALTLDEIEEKPIGYFWDSDVLKRKWTPTRSDDFGWDVVFQLVMPKCLRKQVLSVAHDNVAGHNAKSDDKFWLAPAGGGIQELIVGANMNGFGAPGFLLRPALKLMSNEYVVAKA